MRIIVDAFGGDKAPEEIIKGCVESAEELKQDLVLVGKEMVINNILEQNEYSKKHLYICDAPDVISMEDDPSEIIKSLKNSSMAVGLKLLADGQGDAFVSAGNTGALVIGSTFIVKRIKGVKRAAIATVMPTFSGTPMLLMDSGANVEFRPEMLQEYGLLGSLYMEKVMEVESPRVGLLNVGTEESKGGELRAKAYELLKELPIRFVGNVEARDVPAGACDVVVTDGFTGNVVLKLTEGLASSLLGRLKDIFTKSPVTKMAAAMILKHMREFSKEFDYSEYGGAPLLGLARPVIKAHGSSDATAIKNAIRQGFLFSQSEAIETMRQHLDRRG